MSDNEISGTKIKVKDDRNQYYLISLLENIKAPSYKLEKQRFLKQFGIIIKYLTHVLNV